MGAIVYVVGEGNVVERRYVQLGVVEPDGMVPILEGLDGSETYIVEGLLESATRNAGDPGEDLGHQRDQEPQRRAAAARRGQD